MAKMVLLCWVKHFSKYHENNPSLKVQNGHINLAISHISGCAELFDVTPSEFISLPTEELSRKIKRKSP